MKGLFRRRLGGGAWGAKQTGLVAVMMIVGLGCAGKMHAQMEPEVLTTDDFSFVRGGVELSFVKAYRVFLKAKAGDQKENSDVPSYGQAAQAFAQAAKHARNPEMVMRSKWYMTFCLFLQMDIAMAARAAEITLHSEKNVYPEEVQQLNNLLIQVKDGKILTRAQLEDLLTKAEVVEERTSGKRTFIRKLINILELAEQTRQARGNATDYDLRTRVFELPLMMEQLTGLLAIAGLFEQMSINAAENDEKINQAVCVANLRQLGVFLHRYAHEHEGAFPAPREKKQIWQYQIFEYTGDTAWLKRGIVWTCPSCPSDGFSYGINQNITYSGVLYKIQGKRARIVNPQATMLLADSIHFMPGTYPGKPLYGGAAYKIAARNEHGGTGTVDWARHSGGANVLFVDGHVEWRSGSQLEREFWEGR